MSKEPKPIDDVWHGPDEIPTVNRGNMREFVLAVYWASSGKVCSFACSYLNAYPLQYEHDCPKGDGCEGPGCEGDGCPTTGWFVQTGDDDSAGTFNILDLKDGDRIMGWREIPKWEDRK